ncbi:MAG: hypothetical protein WCL61_01950, partial [bacterium]
DYFVANSTTSSSTFAGQVNAASLNITSSSTTSTLGQIEATSIKLNTLSGVLQAIGGYIVSALVNLTSQVTGILGISNGGTGTSTAPTVGQMLLGNASGTYDLVSTSSLGIPSFSSSSADSWLTSKTTANLTETSSKLFFTDNRARGVISSIIDGIDYASTTGQFTLASGRVIPLNASTTQWASTTALVAASSSNWQSASNIVNASSSNWQNTTNLVNASSSGWEVTRNIVNASSSNWNTAFINRITTASNPLMIGGNAITIAKASSSVDGYLAQGDWSIFNNKENAITASTTATYYRGDKTWATLDRVAVGLSNVENTALSTWAGSSNLTTLGNIAGNLNVLGTGTSTFAGNLAVVGNITAANLGMLSTASSGMVAVAPNDTTKFLRGDATWATIPSVSYVDQSYQKLYLKFDNQSNLLLDSSNYSVTSAVNDNPTYLASGKFAGAVNLGLGGFHTTNNASNLTLGSNDFTLQFWANAPWNGSYAMGTTDGKFSLWIGRVNYRESSVRLPSGADVGFARLGEDWRHVAVRRTGSLLEVLVDGIVVSSNDIGATSYGDNGIWSFPAWWGDGIGGIVDDLSITIGQALSIPSGGPSSPNTGSINGLMAYNDKHSLDLFTSILTVSSSNLGIGTTTPTSALSVVGSGYFSNILNVASTTGTSTFAGYISAQNFTGSSMGINTGDITLANSSNGLILSDQQLTMTLASSTATGTLSVVDWNTFNNKVSSARNILTTGPLLGGGSLAGDLTLSLPAATYTDASTVRLMLKFDDQNNILKDSSQYNNILHKWISDRPLPTYVADGKFGGAITNSGDNYAVADTDASSDFDLGSSDFTFSFFFKTINNVFGNSTVELRRTDTDNNYSTAGGFRVYVDMYGIRLWVANPTNGVLVDNYMIPIGSLSHTYTDNQYHHVAAVRSVSTIYLYYDGEVIYSYNIGTKLVGASNGGSFISMFYGYPPNAPIMDEAFVAIGQAFVPPTPRGPTSQFSNTNYDGYLTWQDKRKIDTLSYLNGNIGLGSTTPSSRLTVTGATYLSDILTVASTTGQSLFAGSLGVSGNLSIGTSSQNGLFQVYTAGQTNINLIPTMTSNTSPSGVASCSSAYNGTTDCFKAFAGSSVAGWLNSGDSSGFLQYQFTSTQTVARYSIKPWSVDNFPYRSPKTWTFEGSNNGTDWTILDTQTDYTSWVVNTSSYFNISSPASYLYYRINVASNGNGGSYLGVQNLSMYALDVLSSPALFVSSGTGQVGFNATNTGLAQVNITPNISSIAGLIIQGATSQTANLQNWQNATGTILATVDKNGYFGIGTTTLSDALTVAGTSRVFGTSTVSRLIINDGISTSYSLVSGVGTYGQVLTTDGTGNTSWSSVASSLSLASSVLDTGATKLLLHFDNSVTPFLDSSSNPKTLYITNNSAIWSATSRTTPKFGAGSIDTYDNWGNGFTLAGNSDFNLGNQSWTIDYWKFAGDTQPAGINTFGVNKSFIRVDRVGNGTLYISSNGTDWDVVNGESLNLILNNSGDGAWNHVSINREGNYIRAYLGGVLKYEKDIGTVAINYNPSDTIYVSNAWNFDEFRILVGTYEIPPLGGPTSAYSNGVLVTSDGLMPGTAMTKVNTLTDSFNAQNTNYLTKWNGMVFASSTIFDSGNIGIGTTTPPQKLTITGNQYLTGAFYDGSYASGTIGMILQSTGTSTRWIATSTLGILSSQWS